MKTEDRRPQLVDVTDKHLPFDLIESQECPCVFLRILRRFLDDDTDSIELSTNILTDVGIADPVCQRYNDSSFADNVVTNAVPRLAKVVLLDVGLFLVIVCILLCFLQSLAHFGRLSSKKW